MDRRLNIASWVLFGLLLLPVFQHATKLLPERKLRGAVTQAPVPSLHAEGWFAGTYQDSMETAINDRFGFRNMFIRINNQVAFSLYRKALASGVIIGKNNYLYEKNYILAANGTDYLGDSVIAARAEKLKALQDRLESDGKHFVVTFAAGKGSFYPEYFPDRYRKAGVADRQSPSAQATNGRSKSGYSRENPAVNRPSAWKTNLQAYKYAFDTLGVHYIDFNDWFLAMKDTSQYDLYPRTGIHWSYYGMVLVIDSLQRYFTRTAGQSMPRFEYGQIRESRNYRSSDDDIEDGMNIIFRINYDRLAYPRVQFRDEGVDKLKGVVIADSFYWGLHNIGFSSRMFDKGEFWYYNNRIIANHLDGPVPLDTIDRMKRLADKDVVMLMATEATLTAFPFGMGELDGL